ncbi:putative O-linked N-acetylglucosamine transferase, SPINDLY family [Burkholderiales bacterium]|nr:putative O-linked N-acetylglucosamine transferase, SPINDLY family [Burkholderiales bacterium]
MQIAHATPDAKKRPGPVRAGRPDPRAEAEYRRGLELAKSERWEQAAAAFGRAVRRSPDDAVFWLNLAHARVKLGDLERAADAARRAAALDPQSELAVSIATQCLAAGNRHEETIEMLRRLDLDHVENSSPHFALGNALTALHRYREAIDAYLAALKRKPDFMPAHAHLGNVFERVKLHVEARECFQTAIALGGARAGLLSAMAYHSQHACRWDLFAQDLADLQQELATGSGQAIPFHLLTMPSTRSQQRAAGYAYWAEHCSTITPLPRSGARTPNQRIRIGYVTNDLFRHATAYLIGDLIESHDRSRFDVYLYSYGHDDGSEIRKRIVSAAGDRFFDARQTSDRQLAEHVRSDDIDILVDLKGYTFGTRMGLFAFHPARIQVNYLGYPGTTGAPCYEYIVGDRIVTPIEHEAGYSEKIAQMPHCYQPNDRRRPVGPRPTRAQCGLPEQGFLFCSFNTCYKITAPVFDRWCRLLRQVDGSVLWLYEANSQARSNLLREAQQRGIAPERIVWAPHLDLPGHLGRLQLADLALDTLPVNSHTTASDALWAGVPLITTAGDTLVSRVASSVLHAVGLPELIAADSDAYEQLALELARDPQRLREIRTRLAANRDHCALFDSPAYARDLEALFTRMLAAWAQGEAPQHMPAATALP